MRITQWGEYGVHCLVYIARKHRQGQSTVNAAEIAAAQGIAPLYAQQILQRLRRRSIIKSVRGPQGGYVLAKKPSELTLKQLFDALEGKAHVWADGREALKADADEVKIANFIFWKKLRASIEDGLASSSLKNLMDQARQTKKEKKSSAAYPFHI